MERRFYGQLRSVGETMLEQGTHRMIDRPLPSEFPTKPGLYAGLVRVDGRLVLLARAYAGTTLKRPSKSRMEADVQQIIVEEMLVSHAGGGLLDACVRRLNALMCRYRSEDA